MSLIEESGRLRHRDMASTPRHSAKTHDATASGGFAVGIATQASTKSHPAAPVLAIKGVSLSFGGVTALTDIDLDVLPGAIHAVIGPNGAGKSSLLNIVTGLYQPDHGRIWLGDKPFAHVPTARLAKLGVARTFQNLSLFKGLTVLDNIVMGLAAEVRSGFLGQIFGAPAAGREQRRHRDAAWEIVEFLKLGAVAERTAGGLPYGIQKRVELGRALVARPKLLLLDEPMAGMTLTEKRELTGFIRTARETYGTSIVLIEHDIGIVMGLSDRVAVLDYGRKIADGTPDQVRSDRAVIDAYLGVAHDVDARGGI